MMKTSRCQAAFLTSELAWDIQVLCRVSPWGQVARPGHSTVGFRGVAALTWLAQSRVKAGPALSETNALRNKCCVYIYIYILLLVLALCPYAMLVAQGLARLLEILSPWTVRGIQATCFLYCLAFNSNRNSCHHENCHPKEILYLP